ncbi:acyl--CoA ligase [Streptomyces sp. NBC_01340]|uniref:class I adenylate-forming enzyme family protein n=1 Tax=Streptomyces TaxID=1883 RepID=UPI0022500E22|nr:MULTISPECIES: class I adenylate-forming enzyme family protein [unclassified Streptomyces]MCX4457448.1 acyl--CoA ligase [Streptomyces sp. NBC_01719]MCX4496805.1 acyl--CoA ligase [Streptomyces sp. NBC_01728]WSI41686.1 acyl--CoA ligase [Streptomyces sp. NBC_01340]
MSEIPSGPAVPLDGLLRRAAERHPERVAVRDERGATNYARLDAYADEFARALLRLTGGRRTAVGVASVLDQVFAAAFYGAARSGNRIVMVNPLVREPVLEHVFGTAGIEIALVSAETAARLATVRANLPALREVYVVDADRVGPLPEGARPLADLLAGGGPAAPALPGPAGVELDSVVCVQFTSGTTGPPKGVQLTHRNLVANAAQAAHALGLDADSVCLNHLPLYHLMHLNAAVYAGATQALCHDPDPVASFAAAADTGATHYFGLPVRLTRLAADQRLASVVPGSGLRLVASGGSALAPAVAARLRDQLGVPVIQGYGLAELSPLSHNDRPERSKPGSVGPAVPGTECRVVDLETGADLGPGHPGEVLLRGPQLMTGYLGLPDAPDIDAAGWFHTGDVGYQDEDGWLFLVDRIKDVFKVDNELVSPSEIERILLHDADVADCVVVDMPDEFSGAVVWAGVVPVGDRPVDLRLVVARANAQLSEHQRIRRAERLKAVPRSPNGKAERRSLRERLRADAA